jgi:hypothetical protein
MTYLHLFTFKALLKWLKYSQFSEFHIDADDRGYEPET